MDIDFTIEDTIIYDAYVTIKIRVDDCLEKYFSFNINRRAFEKMNEEQLEYECYKVAKTKVSYKTIKNDELKIKAENIKASIAKYNKDKFNK